MVRDREDTLVGQPELLERGGALLHRQAVTLRPLREAPITLKHTHCDAALLQRERERGAADAATHDGDGGRRRSCVQRQYRWP